MLEEDVDKFEKIIIDQINVALWHVPKISILFGICYSHKRMTAPTIE